MRSLTFMKYHNFLIIKEADLPLRVFRKVTNPDTTGCSAWGTWADTEYVYPSLNAARLAIRHSAAGCCDLGYIEGIGNRQVECGEEIVGKRTPTPDIDPEDAQAIAEAEAALEELGLEDGEGDAAPQ